jgi:hypothetical protein
MAQIPSFLNINEFFGVFLAGYVAATLYIILFQPQLFFSQDQSISVDLFAAVVFIVAGPTIGFALRQFHRQILEGFFLYIPRKGRSESEKRFKDFSQMRSRVTDAERLELERSEAYYDFKISIFIVLLLLTTYHITSASPPDFRIYVPLYILASFFLVGGILYRKHALCPYINFLYDKYMKCDNELVVILNDRLSKREITEDQYEKMKKVIES